MAFTRAAKKVFLVLVLLGVALQLVPYGRNRTNPPVLAEPPWDSPRTRELFFRACADCHSNETRWPWYSALAPTSWLIVRDVQEGRAHFNVSEWGVHENEHAHEAAEEVEKGKMPPKLYALFHRSARLSPSEKEELLHGLRATFGSEAEGKQGKAPISKREETSEHHH